MLPEEVGGGTWYDKKVGGYGGGTTSEGDSEYVATLYSAGQGGGFGIWIIIYIRKKTIMMEVKVIQTAEVAGGWYGGGTATFAGPYVKPGGGSGWVYTENNYNLWRNQNPNDANQYLLNSSFYLTNAQTIAGNTEFPAPSGGNETGHSGDGYARITCLE